MYLVSGDDTVILDGHFFILKLSYDNASYLKISTVLSPKFQTSLHFVKNVQAVFLLLFLFIKKILIKHTCMKIENRMSVEETACDFNTWKLRGNTLASKDRQYSHPHK